MGGYGAQQAGAMAGGYGAVAGAQQWAGYQAGGAADPNMSAWQAYYQQYYGATGAAAVGAAAPGATPAVAGTAAAAAAQPSINPQTGQPDYSQAWVEYYRSLGMHDQADAILRQTQVRSEFTLNIQK